MAASRVSIVIGELICNEQRIEVEKDLLSVIPGYSRELLQSILDQLSTLPVTSTMSPTVGDGRLLTRSSDNLLMSVAFRPTLSDFNSILSNLLTPPQKPDEAVNAILLYVGLSAEGSGHWLLPDYVITPIVMKDHIQKFMNVYPSPTDAENQPPYKPIQLHIGMTSIGDWRQLVGNQIGTLGGHPVLVNLTSSLMSARHKPTAAGDGPIPPSLELSALEEVVRSMLIELPNSYCPPLLTTLSSRDGGDLTLRVGRPCLYVFPEGSGQSAILTLPGYNMLINAGCMHRPRFWKVATHLDRLDSLLLTHWGLDNILGLSSVLPALLERKSSEPRDSVVCLLTPPPNPSVTTSFPALSTSRSPLCLSLPRQMADVINQVRQSGANLVTYPVTRGTKIGATSQMLQLYKKVGQGSLDLHVLTPTDDDSTELRKLTDDWTKAMPSLMTTPIAVGKMGSASKFSVPLLSHMSVSALVMWRPALDTEPILRILFVSPNAHQARILVSLEAVVAANICLRHPKGVPAEMERKRSVAPRKSSIPSSGATRITSINSAGGVVAKQLPAKRHTISTKPLAPVSSTTQKPTKSTGSKPALPPKTNAAPKPVVNAAEPLPKPVKLPVEKHEQLPNGVHEAASEPTAPLNQILSDALNSSMNISRFDNEDEATLVAHEASAIEPDGPLNVVASPNTDVLEDTVAAWGAPQNLPPPVPGRPKPTTNGISVAPRRSVMPMSSRNTGPPRTARANGTGTVTYAPGCTDASAHATGVGSTKSAPYDKVKPVYVDISYVPGGGNTHLVDAEWFKRIRARYVVITDPNPTASIMEAMTVGKESWTGDDAKLQMSIIFAHESDDLLHWLGRNAGRLAACLLNVVAVTSRSNIQLMGSEGGPLFCPGYRIDL